MGMHLDIVTPEKKVFSDEVDSVALPGAEGDMEILPNHAPFVTTLKPGELVFSHGGKKTELAVGEGIIEVSFTHVSILTDLAVADAEIDEKVVEEAMQRAQDQLKNAEDGDPEEYAMLQATILKQMAQLKLKRKRL